MVFVGVQPVLIQVPPASLRSITAVFFPAATRTSARGLPPCPEPMMMASKFSVVLASAVTRDHLQVSQHYDACAARRLRTPPWVVLNRMSNQSGGRIHLAHLGFGGQGDCILQAEGDDRLRRN